MYNSMITGRKSGVGTTPVQIMSTDNLADNGIQIYANIANTDIVWIGESTVTADSADATDGFPLNPGDGIFIPLRHPNVLYARSSTDADQKIWWVLV